MSWNKILKIAECKVGLCAARDCINNKEGRCTLEYISIGADGNCNQLTKDEMRGLHHYTPGQQSFIDRATRNLREEQAGREE